MQKKVCKKFAKKVYKKCLQKKVYKKSLIKLWNRVSFNNNMRVTVTHSMSHFETEAYLRSK